LFPNVQMVAV